MGVITAEVQSYGLRIEHFLPKVLDRPGAATNAKTKVTGEARGREPDIGEIRTEDQNMK